MSTRVDYQRINELAERLKQLSKEVEDQSTSLYREVRSTLSRTRSSYSESYVRIVIEDIESILQTINRQAAVVSDKMNKKSSTLKWAAGEYKKAEEKSKIKVTKPWPMDALSRGWGPIRKEEYDRRMGNSKIGYSTWSGLLDFKGIAGIDGMKKETIKQETKDIPWTTDALNRGWGPINKEEYDRRITTILNNSAMGLQQITSASNTYKTAIDKSNFMKLDPNKITPGTLERLNYLIERISTLEDGEKVWEQMDHIGLWYTREDYERELDRLMELLENPTYRTIEEYSAIGLRVGEGVLQAIGGATEVITGKVVATCGSWTIIAVPVGGYLIVDGGSNAVEGALKVRNALFSPETEKTYNFLRDTVYKGALGEQQGEDWYNKASVAAGIFCMGKGVYDMKKAGLIKTFARPAHIAKAESLHLPTEVKILDTGDKLVITIQELNKSTKTPMILERIIINTKEIANKGAFLYVDGFNTQNAYEVLMEQERLKSWELWNEVE